MKCIKTTDAVGHVLCHDITRIVKDVVKDTAFRKGHIVQEEDIPVLLSLGKDHLYVWEKDENTLHENEAAQILCNDDMEKITAAIMKLKEEGADLIVCTGGMSVDPDDKTPGAIKNTGARIVSYGAPVLPGAMFLLSYLEDGTPVMGLPGCVMYAKATVFDLVLPRIIAGIEVTKKDLAHMGNGGFCLGCKECHYPNCSFGKGV